MKVLPSTTFAWRTNRQGNDPWRPAAKQIVFPWPSILGGICLAAGRQGSFPWRFVRRANVIDGKTFIEPRKCYDRQGYNFPWRL